VRKRTLAALLGGFGATFFSGYLLCALALHPALQPPGSSSTSHELLAVPFSYLLLVAGEAEVLVAVLGAYFLGGVVAGGISRRAPGAAGVASAALAAPFATAWLLAAVPPFLYVRATLIDPLSGSVAVGTGVFWAVVYSAFLALALGAACLGGRLGSRGPHPEGPPLPDEARR
jgi:hypothetical protein